MAVYGPTGMCNFVSFVTNLTFPKISRQFFDYLPK